MDAHIPIAVQNENIHIRSGKGVDGMISNQKPMRKGQKTRKALADISKAGKISVPSAAKVSSSKEGPAANDNQKPKGVSKNPKPTEELQRCKEWSKEGIEHMHFSGNDLLSLQKDLGEERVKKKVDKVISALRGWILMSYGFEIQAKEPGSDPEDLMTLEPDPEVLLPELGTSRSTAVKEDFDDLLHGEIQEVWLNADAVVDLKLLENEGDMVCLL